MSRVGDGSLTHVVTFRITDDEKQDLEDLVTAHRTSVSTLMRGLIKKFCEASIDNIGVRTRY